MARLLYLTSGNVQHGPSARHDMLRSPRGISATKDQPADRPLLSTAVRGVLWAAQYREPTEKHENDMSDEHGISLACDGIDVSARTPSVGNRVRMARTKDVGMTLNQFAEAVGVSVCSLSVLENGARPSKETVEKIAAFLGRPVHDLDPDAWAFDRHAPRRVNEVARSAQHASVGARGRNISR